MAEAKQQTKPEKRASEDNTKKGGGQQVSASPVASAANKSGESKKSGFLFGFFAFLVAFLIIAGILGTTFYFIIHNNFNNLAVKYRSQISAIPVARLALPKLPDPEDPANFTQAQLKDKYNEVRKTRDDFKKQLEAAQAQIAELQKNAAELSRTIAANDAEKAQAAKSKEEQDKKELQLKEDEKRIGEMIATGDKAGFKEYFEKVDKETAQKVYSEIIKEDKVSEDTKKFAQIYDAMDPKATAKIFTQLGEAKLELVCETLKNMKKEVSAQVLAAMDPAFASKVTQRLSEMYKGTWNVSK